MRTADVLSRPFLPLRPLKAVSCLSILSPLLLLLYYYYYIVMYSSQVSSQHLTHKTRRTPTTGSETPLIKVTHILAERYVTVMTTVSMRHVITAQQPPLLGTPADHNIHYQRSGRGRAPSPPPDERSQERKQADVNYLPGETFCSTGTSDRTSKSLPTGPSDLTATLTRFRGRWRFDFPRTNHRRLTMRSHDNMLVFMEL